MKILDRFFLNTKTWIVFITFLFLPSILGLVFGPADKYLVRQTTYSTARLSIGNPVKLITSDLILLLWMWAIANFFNRILITDSKNDSGKIGGWLAISLLISSLTSVFIYYTAEMIFNLELTYILPAILLGLISILMHLICAWKTITIIKKYFEPNKSPLLFQNDLLDTILFPISVWKMHRTIIAMQMRQEIV